MRFTSITPEDFSRVIDVNLRRIVRHEEPPSANRPELDDAQRIVEAEAQRREALFQQSVAAEKTRGDALSRRFEEALASCDRAIALKPDLVEAFTNRGNALKELRRFDEALPVLERRPEWRT